LKFITRSIEMLEILSKTLRKILLCLTGTIGEQVPYQILGMYYIFLFKVSYRPIKADFYSKTDFWLQQAENS